MDEFKKQTLKDYTAWDLCYPKIYRPKWRNRLATKLKRKVRRKMKQETKNLLTKTKDHDII